MNRVKEEDRRISVGLSMSPRVIKKIKASAKRRQMTLSAEVELRVIESLAREQWVK